MSESTGKIESISRENVWVGSLGSFLVRRVLETDCVVVLEEESSGSYDVGIAASKKANRQNEGGGCHVPSSKMEGIALAAAAAHQIRVFLRVRAKKTQSRVGFRPLNWPTE